jgi:hypothetical protein
MFEKLRLGRLIGRWRDSWRRKARKSWGISSKGIELAAESTMFFSMKKTEKSLAVRKISFQADNAFFERLDVAARTTKVSRSWLIREVVGGWLNDKKFGVEP